MLNIVIFIVNFIEKDDEIIICGAVGPYKECLTESSLFTIFVDSKYQGQGYGKKIIKVLENDDYYKRATRIEIPASISAIPFYIKFGYKHKNGELEIILEKYKKKVNIFKTIYF